MRRREFLKSTAVAPGAGRFVPELTAKTNAAPELGPARWIWYPSGRTLPNTFVLFRRDVPLPAPPLRAAGWIGADSRYLLEVNGRRIQWGPAPCDPRWLELDPIDLAGALSSGANSIGARVLYYGHGDGTWPAGKPGFLFHLALQCADGSEQIVVSDAAWKAVLARAWAPGRPKRWFLRALQEEFDARLFPHGWSEPGFNDTDWLPAMTLDVPSGKPPVCSNYPDYLHGMDVPPQGTGLRARSIPLLREIAVPVARLAESYRIRWLRPAGDYFDFRVPDAYRVEEQDVAAEISPGVWRLTLDGERAAALTFEFSEQMSGWPYFTIDAPAGAVIELLVHEGHQPGGPVLINSHFDAWSRFSCREGRNRFEPFDFESGRWVQLHIHGARGAVTVRDVGWRRRIFPWPHAPVARCSNAEIDRLLRASINTLHNCAHDVVAGDSNRERQQYSGDCGHQTHALYMAFGETRLPARYLATFSQGMTLDGYFLDCWPAWDRLARLWERQLNLTRWGPILDHGVGFNFDCYYHYLYTGDLEALREPYARLLRFARYLESIVDANGLLPVENLGVPSVWIDHAAYTQQRHKQCAFNLYAAAMLEHALAPICRAFHEDTSAEAAAAFGRRLLAATVKRYWSPERKLFVNNLPWLSEEKQPRYCDRALATAVLYDQIPGGNATAAVRVLAGCPPEMGLSYPANAGWRLWALARAGRADVIVRDLKTRWASMDSVRLNNTLQENWHIRPDTSSEWSHCGVVPLYIAYMGLAGIRPLEPGFARCEIRPQPVDLELLELTAHTPLGRLRFSSRGNRGNREIVIDVPENCRAELVAGVQERLPLAPGQDPAPPGCGRWRLPEGRSTLVLRHT